MLPNIESFKIGFIILIFSQISYLLVHQVFFYPLHFFFEKVRGIVFVQNFRLFVCSSVRVSGTFLENLRADCDETW